MIFVIKWDQLNFVYLVILIIMKTYNHHKFPKFYLRLGALYGQKLDIDLTCNSKPRESWCRPFLTKVILISPGGQNYFDIFIFPSFDNNEKEITGIVYKTYLHKSSSSKACSRWQFSLHVKYLVKILKIKALLCKLSQQKYEPVPRFDCRSYHFRPGESSY